MTLTHQTRVYLHGAIAAAINGFSSGVLLVMAAPDKFNLADGASAKRLFFVSCGYAVFSFFTFIKDHPLPNPNDSDYASATQAALTRIAGTGDGSVSVQSVVEKAGPSGTTITALDSQKQPPGGTK